MHEIQANQSMQTKAHMQAETSINFKVHLDIASQTLIKLEKETISIKL
jgi:hypothetical protein